MSRGAFLGGFLAFVMTCAVASAGAEPDLSTPEATVRSFAAAFSSGKVSIAAQCVEGKPDPKVLKEWEEEWTKKGSVLTQIALKNLKTETKGEEATATFALEISSPSTPLITDDETIELSHSLQGWRIVPFTVDGLALHLKQPDASRTIKQLATYTVHPELYLGIKAKYRLETQAKNRLETCRANLRQLTSGLLYLTKANNSKLALKADNFKAAVTKYTRNETLLYCPEHVQTSARIASYSFNPALEGKNPDVLKNADKIVMAYEGRAGKLDFRHNGKAFVAFADGHVARVDAKQKLLWK